jgi:nitrite reductase/ring-hydroxylating ferredoxin subunit
VSLHLVAQLDELEDATPKVFAVAGRSVGLIKSNGRIHAVRNVCPHKGAPVCRGTFRGTMLPSDPGTFVFGLDDRILQCPWHGWEFDLNTGQTLCGNGNKKLMLYPVTVKEGAIYIELGRDQAR